MFIKEVDRIDGDREVPIQIALQQRLQPRYPEWSSAISLCCVDSISSSVPKLMARKTIRSESINFACNTLLGLISKLVLLKS